MKLYLVPSAALLLAACSSPTPSEDSRGTESPARPAAPAATGAKTAAATGMIGVTKVDAKRFWIAFDGAKGTWMGGHTPPATGILPVTSGKFVIGAHGLVLQSKDGKTIGHLKAFFGHTAVGQTGEGTIETSAELFRWTAT